MSILLAMKLSLRGARDRRASTGLAARRIGGWMNGFGPCGRSERKRAAHNSALLARATRRTRALRLEHDPQPGLNGCTVRHRRGFFTADGFGLAGETALSGCP